MYKQRKMFDGHLNTIDTLKEKEPRK